MLITLLVSSPNSKPWQIQVDDNITLLELKKKIAEYYHTEYTGFYILKGNECLDSDKDNYTLNSLGIKRLIRLGSSYEPGGYIDNIKNEIDLNIGFDMNLIKRNELYVNLIHFDSNITNSENYEYFNNFKVDVIGGFYAIDDINIFKNYLEKIKEKDIPFIVLCSGSAGKDIIPICKKYSFIKEVIIFCFNYSYNEHYIHEYPGYVRKVLTSISSVYDYIKTFGSNYKNIIDANNTTEKYHFSSEEISMKRQFLQCPVITAEEYDRCYFLVHRAYAHFFGDMDDKYEKPKYTNQNHSKVIACIEKIKFLGGKTEGLSDKFNGLLNCDNNNKFIEKAIWEYTDESSFCYLLNRIMRNFESGLISLSYYMGPLLYGLNKYVKENPDYAMSYNMTLYRKIKLSKVDFYLYKINKGHIICFPSLTSTSDEDDSFSPTGYGNDNSDDMITIKLIIKYHHESGNKSPGIIVKDKKRTNDSGYLSRFPKENEITLFPFTFLRINNIDGNNIYLEIINRKKYIEYALKNDIHNRIKFSD